MKIQLFLYVFVLTFLVACNPRENEAARNQLPRVTTHGANTFGCLINDELWLPNSHGGVDAMDVRQWSTDSTDVIWISANYCFISKNIYDGLDFYIRDYKELGLYYLKPDDIIFTNTNCGEYRGIDSTSSWVEILYENAGTVSGEFELTFINIDEDENCLGDTLHITKGRFDIR